MSTHPDHDRTVSIGAHAVGGVVLATILAGAVFGTGPGARFVPPALEPMSTAVTRPSGVHVALHPASATPAGPAGVRVVEHAAGGGKLVICGGGKLPKPIRDQFCKFAGGSQGRIVVIPTATA